MKTKTKLSLIAVIVILALLTMSCGLLDNMFADPREFKINQRITITDGTTEQTYEGDCTLVQVDENFVSNITCKTQP